MRTYDDLADFIEDDYALNINKACMKVRRHKLSTAPPIEDMLLVPQRIYPSRYKPADPYLENIGWRGITTITRQAAATLLHANRNGNRTALTHAVKYYIGAT